MSGSDAETARRRGDLVVDRAWLGRVREPTVLPAQAIVDPHIHLWLEQPIRYTPQDYLADIDGHAVEATVFAECRTEYLVDGPAHLRPVGEVRFALEQSEVGRAIAPKVAMCAAIGAYADLGPPELFRETIEAEVAMGGGLLRSIRPTLYAHDDPSFTGLRDERWSDWADTLQQHEILLEAWVSSPQLRDLSRLAQRHPEMGIVVNHLGGPAGAADDHDQSSDLRATWLDGLRMLAACPNVVVKLGGMGTSVFGYRCFVEDDPPTSSTLATMWRPWFEPVIDIFGPDRCMFESNYPVDARVGGLHVVWNCFKLLAEEYAPDERDALCRQTAARTYRIVGA